MFCFYNSKSKYSIFNLEQSIYFFKKKGYLYDINLKHPNLIATYSYTGETLTSICERYLFTATSDHGLAIWTLRPSDFPEISTFEPCVLGIQQFFGLHSISVTSDFIILLILQYLISNYLSIFIINFFFSIQNIKDFPKKHQLKLLQKHLHFYLC